MRNLLAAIVIAAYLYVALRNNYFVVFNTLTGCNAEPTICHPELVSGTKHNQDQGHKKDKVVRIKNKLKQ